MDCWKTSISAIWSSDVDILAHGGQRVVRKWDWSAGLAHVVDAADLFGSGVKCDSSPCESSSDSSNAQSAEPRLLRILRRHGVAALRLLAVVKCDYYEIKGFERVYSWRARMCGRRCAPVRG